VFFLLLRTFFTVAPRHLVLCNVEVFGINETHPVMWPHPSLLNVKHGKPGQSCVEACSDHQMVHIHVDTRVIYCFTCPIQVTHWWLYYIHVYKQLWDYFVLIFRFVNVDISHCSIMQRYVNTNFQSFISSAYDMLLSRLCLTAVIVAILRKLLISKCKN